MIGLAIGTIYLIAIFLVSRKYVKDFIGESDMYPDEAP
jgi:hypothetical protein